MANIELSYVLITPYSLMKSRTGGIIARLLSRTNLELVGAQVLTFDNKCAQEYAELLKNTVEKRNSEDANLLVNYVLENFSERSDGKRHRVMMLLFRGKNACKKLFNVVGPIGRSRVGHYQDGAITGETIRDTYSDLVMDGDTVRYFEPAVLTPPTVEDADEKMRFFAEFAKSSSNIVDNTVTCSDGTERTLVIIKPDNWRHPSTKPGNVIDMLSFTGLRIIGAKIHKMPVIDALEFYGPVKNALRKKIAPAIGKKAYDMLEKEFDVKLPEAAEEKLSENIGVSYADKLFSNIIEFMSGRRPEECTEEELDEPGLAKCMVLIYEGIDAIAKIRKVLGPTDPTKAPGGTVRRDFGHDVMVNTAHASDAPKSVIREMGIIKISDNELALRITEYLENDKVKI
jgi:nucleoside diphosphate kinase